MHPAAHPTRPPDAARSRRASRAGGLGLLGLLALASSAAAQALPAGNEAAEGRWGYDQPMLHDPEVAGPEYQKVFQPRQKELWTAALKRPDVDTRRLAAEAIADAHARGFADLSDLFPALRAQLEAPEVHPILARMVAQALIKVDDRAAAAALLKLDQTGGLEASLIADPALARWGFAPASALWRQRMGQADLPLPLRLSALASLGVVRDPEARAGLLALALESRQAPPLRLGAARALGRVAESGLNADAGRLASGAVIDRLCAAAMLAGHKDRAAVDLLLKLAVDAEPTVAATALARLLEIDPNLVDRDLALRLRSNADANVRHLIARALAAHRTEGSVAALGPMLDDVNPKLRRYAREALGDLAAQPPLKAAVLAAATTVLHAPSWRGLEQAAFLLSGLDHKPAAGRLVELLPHPRAEVRLAACVGLRRLAVPDTFPAMVSRAERLTDQLKAQAAATANLKPGDPLPLPDFSPGQEVSQLFQAMGQTRHKPAETLLRSYVPKKTRYPEESRGAAVWALGYLHQGAADAGLAREFAQRLADLSPLDPEATMVRQMSAISLGRMKAQSGLGPLRRFLREENASAEIGGSCRWAIMQITGETLPPLNKLTEGLGPTFLEPIE